MLLIDSNGKPGNLYGSSGETEGKAPMALPLEGATWAPANRSIHGKVEKLYYGKIIFVNVYYVDTAVVLGDRE